MTLDKDKRDILVLFNLENDDVEDVSFLNKDNMAIVDVFLRPSYPPCKDCGNTNVRIKGYVIKKVNHGVLTDRKCILNYHARRYVCPVCGRTFYEPNPFVFNSMKISALSVHNVLKDLKKQNETFSSVAQRYHMSPTSAASIFDRHVIMNRLPLPEYMCWDETYAFHHQGENSKYVFTMINFRTLEAVDILPSRRSDYLRKYFLNIPLEERNQVRMIATDMYKEYRYIIQDLFRQSIHVVDHYHVSQEMSRKADAVRLRVMKSIPKYVKGTKKHTDEYYLLKKFHWMIFKRPDEKHSDNRPLFDPNRERILNQKLKRMLNFYDIRNLIEAIHPDLEAAWRLKDDLVDFYDSNTYETAQENIKHLIMRLHNSGVPEMRAFARTLSAWQDEIVNSFIVIQYNHKVDKDTGLVIVSAKKMNNGLMENRNSILKTIKKSSNGYYNWDRFRNRCLYVLRPDAVPLLYPVDPDKNKK